MSDLSSPAGDPARATESPPTGRPKREGNESLWKRARRTLGTNSLQFLQPQDRPQGTSTTTPGSGPAPPNKRREQVRHAQRTHRQRTQNYIKTLESEVVRLRESETTLIGEREKLRAQVETLKASLRSSNTVLPPGFEETPSDLGLSQAFTGFDMPALVSLSTDDLAHERLHVTWPTQASAVPGPSSPLKQDLSMMQHLGSHPDYNLLSDFTQDLSLHPPSLSTDSPSPLHVSSNQSSYAIPAETKAATSSIGNLEVAVDFVLALEHPCMQHIPYPANPATPDPANHVMMMSAPLVAFAPDSPRPNSTWHANTAIIKELLNLSSSINLEGELTPVEAWHRLRQHPDFWRFDSAGINRLKKDLSAEVRCYGFGAVLDEYAFLRAVHNLLATSVAWNRP